MKVPSKALISLILVAGVGLIILAFKIGIDSWYGPIHREEDVSVPEPQQPDPSRKVKTPRSPDYDAGYKCNTTLVEYNGYTVTFWTLGSLYSPGNPIDGFLRIEASPPRGENDVDQFRPGAIQAIARRFADNVQVRNDNQKPQFYHVRRDRLGLEAHLVDLVSTSSIRVGEDAANYLPRGQYLLELTVEKGDTELVRIKDIYIEFAERRTPIFDAERLRKARHPILSIPAIRGGPIDDPKKSNTEGI